VAIDTVLSETASIAHYVLPSLSTWSATRPWTQAQREAGPGQHPAAGGETLFDTKPGTQIIIDLAKHLGWEIF
jgi:anaerobic selenocysteine-containing dehydrogenase